MKLLKLKCFFSFADRLTVKVLARKRKLLLHSWAEGTFLAKWESEIRHWLYESWLRSALYSKGTAGGSNKTSP